MIAACLSALAIVSTPRLAAAPVPCFEQSPAALVQEPQAPAEKKAKSEKKPKKVKKAKKNKVAADEEPSPDEPVDPQADAPGGGLKFSWKQHPSMRYGDVFRLDV